MKKIFAVLFVASLVYLLVGCVPLADSNTQTSDSTPVPNSIADESIPFVMLDGDLTSEFIETFYVFFDDSATVSAVVEDSGGAIMVDVHSYKDPETLMDQAAGLVFVAAGSKHIHSAQGVLQDFDSVIFTFGDNILACFIDDSGKAIGSVLMVPDSEQAKEPLWEAYNENAMFSQWDVTP